MSTHDRVSDSEATPPSAGGSTREEAAPARRPRSSAEAAALEPCCTGYPLSQRIEALLFTADRPLSDSRIADLLGLDVASPSAVAEAIDELNRSYAHTGRVFRIEPMAGGRRVLTMSEFGPLIERLRGSREHAKLSQAALETLAIIAYRQPALRAELEAIRGVACGEVLKTLIDRRLVRVTGRAEIVGRPLLYGTSREFLQVFGLQSLDDLPRVTAGTERPSA